MTDPNSTPYAVPFDLTTEPDEPPRGAVLAYQRLGHSGVTLDYVSMRAGDGLWYTTGETSMQAVKWGDLWATIRRHAVGAVRYATAWAELDFPRPVTMYSPKSDSAYELEVRRRLTKRDDSPEWTIS